MSTIVPEPFAKRADLFIQAGDLNHAIADYRRAIEGFPGYASVLDRWRKLIAGKDEAFFVDLKTSTVVRPGVFDLWIKKAQDKSLSNSSYTLLQYEVNCASRQVRINQVTRQGGGTRPIRLVALGKWIRPAPDGFDERVYDRLCPQVRR